VPQTYSSQCRGISPSNSDYSSGYLMPLQHPSRRSEKASLTDSLSLDEFHMARDSSCSSSSCGGSRRYHPNDDKSYQDHVQRRLSRTQLYQSLPPPKEEIHDSFGAACVGAASRPPQRFGNRYYQAAFLSMRADPMLVQGAPHPQRQQESTNPADEAFYLEDSTMEQESTSHHHDYRVPQSNQEQQEKQQQKDIRDGPHPGAAQKTKTTSVDLVDSFVKQESSVESTSGLPQVLKSSSGDQESIHHLGCPVPQLKQQQKKIRDIPHPWEAPKNKATSVNLVKSFVTQASSVLPTSGPSQVSESSSVYQESSPRRGYPVPQLNQQQQKDIIDSPRPLAARKTNTTSLNLINSFGTQESSVSSTGTPSQVLESSSVDQESSTHRGYPVPQLNQQQQKDILDSPRPLRPLVARKTNTTSAYLINSFVTQESSVSSTSGPSQVLGHRVFASVTPSPQRPEFTIESSLDTTGSATVTTRDEESTERQKSIQISPESGVELSPATNSSSSYSSSVYEKGRIERILQGKKYSQGIVGAYPREGAPETPHGSPSFNLESKAESSEYDVGAFEVGSLSTMSSNTAGGGGRRSCLLPVNDWFRVVTESSGPSREVIAAREAWEEAKPSFGRRDEVVLDVEEPKPPCMNTTLQAALYYCLNRR
jgi:hypothetical protein